MAAPQQAAEFTNACAKAAVRTPLALAFTSLFAFCVVFRNLAANVGVLLALESVKSTPKFRVVRVAEPFMLGTMPKKPSSVSLSVVRVASLFIATGSRKRLKVRKAAVVPQAIWCAAVCFRSQGALVASMAWSWKSSATIAVVRLGATRSTSLLTSCINIRHRAAGHVVRVAGC